MWCVRDASRGPVGIRRFWRRAFIRLVKIGDKMDDGKCFLAPVYEYVYVSY